MTPVAPGLVQVRALVRMSLAVSDVLAPLHRNPAQLSLELRVQLSKVAQESLASFPGLPPLPSAARASNFGRTSPSESGLWL